MHVISAPMTPGDTIPFTAGRVTITLQMVREDVYTVTTYQGTLRIEDQCGSYSTEAIARSVARLYASLAKAEAEATPVASLAVLAEVGSLRQTRPTMAGAQLASVTNPQHRALATAAVLGRVERGNGRGRESVATLKALDRKGYLTLTMRPGKRYDIAYGVITQSGTRELARLDAEADRRERSAQNIARLQPAF